MSRAYNAYIESAVRVHGALSEPQEKWLDPPDPERDELLGSPPAQREAKP